MWRLLASLWVGISGFGAEMDPTAIPRRGGQLRLALQNDFATLDPVQAPTTDHWAFQRLMFHGLFDYDVQGRLILDQAQDWALSEDQRTYTFHLKSGIRFANGREVEAEDYRFALERVLNPESGSDGQIAFLGILGAKEFADGKTNHVMGVRAPNRRTLIVELVEPSYIFPFKLAWPSSAPVPRELLQKSSREFRAHLAGSGPYQLQEHIPGQRWLFIRNSHYTGPGGFPESVELSIGGELFLHTMMVERGEIDLSQLSQQDYRRLERDSRVGDFVKALAYPNVHYVFMNTELKPFDDARVRKAVSLTLDRERLAKLLPPSAPAYGILPPWMPEAAPERRAMEHNAARARTLLSDAGYPNGFNVELWYPLGYLGTLPEAIQEQLRLVGIQVTLRPVTSIAMFEKVSTRKNASMGLYGWIVDYPDPMSFFDPTLDGSKITDSQCYNYAFYNNPDVVRMIAQADRIFDPIQRTQLLRRIEATVLDDAPWAPVVHEKRVYLLSRRLRGFQPHPVWRYRLDALWLDR